jgi:lipid-binding SYLF domain-containing protein
MKLLLVALLALAQLTAQGKDKEPADRLREAAAVFSEIMAATDTSIPQDLLTDAHCIVIVPGLKTAAFVFGAKYGKGYLSCRSTAGKGWSAPGTVRIEGGSVGFQIGGSSTDLIMLVMTERGADKLLSSKFTLGVEGSVAAGPVGRTATAQTDAQMKADILSWSRSQGLFAGVALEGATLRQDLDDNATLYGKKLENREIVTTGVHAPKAAAELLALLNKHSAREGSGVSSAAERATEKKAVHAAGNVESGKVVFEKNCRSCHGVDGNGNPAIAKAMKVTMRGLDSKEVRAKSDEELKKDIAEGTGKMKPTKGLADAQIAALIAYVRSLGKP